MKQVAPKLSAVKQHIFESRIVYDDFYMIFETSKHIALADLREA